MMSQAKISHQLPVQGRHLTMRPVAPAGLRQALALLLTGRQGPADLAVDQFLDFTRSRQMALDRFWIIEEQSPPPPPPSQDPTTGEPHPAQPLLAILTIQAPGHAGMLFLSPLMRQRDIPLAAQAIDLACQSRFVTDLALVQMLLDPYQRYERQAALDGGFAELAHLQYMRRRISSHHPTPLPEGLTLSPWPPEDQDTPDTRDTTDTRALFTQAILASYIDTMDCPGLVGLRQMDDIIAGHKGTGTFDPKLWQVLHRGSEPCGVMLINRLASNDAMELAYLGLTPAVRGQGLGKILLEHGLKLAYSQGAREMLLAVDENNAPALKLYSAMKFTPTARKLALLRAVRPG